MLEFPCPGWVCSLVISSTQLGSSAWGPVVTILSACVVTHVSLIHWLIKRKSDPFKYNGCDTPHLGPAVICAGSLHHHPPSLVPLLIRWPRELLPDDFSAPRVLFQNPETLTFNISLTFVSAKKQPPRCPFLFLLSTFLLRIMLMASIPYPIPVCLLEILFLLNLSQSFLCLHLVWFFLNVVVLLHTKIWIKHLL